MEHLHNWVFNFNPYTKKWAAIPRQLYNEYWNNHELEGVIRSSFFPTLLEILSKTEGVDVEKKLNIE